MYVYAICKFPWVTFQALKEVTDFQEIWREIYATVVPHNIVNFNFLRPVIKIQRTANFWAGNDTSGS